MKTIIECGISVGEWLSNHTVVADPMATTWVLAAALVAMVAFVAADLRR